MPTDEQPGTSGQPREFSEVVRRNRTPEAFNFGPDLSYGTLSTNSVGKYRFLNQGERGVLSDQFCNAMIVTFADTNQGGTAAKSVVIRISTRRDIISPVASDIVIYHSQAAGAVLVVPMFSNVYSVTCWVLGDGGNVYPDDVGFATSVVFC